MWWRYAIALLFLGIIVPAYKGIDLLDPLVLLIYAMIPSVLAGPLALRWSAAKAILAAWTTGLLMFCLALATVNLTHHYRHLLLPSPTLCLTAASLSLAGVAAMTGISKLAAQLSANPRAI